METNEMIFDRTKTYLVTYTGEDKPLVYRYHKGRWEYSGVTENINSKITFDDWSMSGQIIGDRYSRGLGSIGVREVDLKNLHKLLLAEKLMK
jgi:hypothetical protein